MLWVLFRVSLVMIGKEQEYRLPRPAHGLVDAETRLVDSPPPLSPFLDRSSSMFYTCVHANIRS